ncbi:MAG: SulP family inorganic anion transporter [Myxococcota bacterium]|nr:SulP family inorganic anion transporter [Myxococcota bacterium]
MSATHTEITGPHDRNVKAELPQNILAGLTVSFAAISLGAAFGLQSGRDNGIVVGIFSAGLIAFITSLLGGTRIQCSGPTAPMTTVTMAIWAAATGMLATQLSAAGYTADHFMTVILLLTGGLLLLMAVFRLGKYITYVPAMVISGFMNGIAILIWVGEIKKLFGIGGSKAYDGGLGPNVTVALITLILLFTLPKIINATLPKYRSFLPGTLITIIVVSIVVHAMGLGIETPTLKGIKSFQDLTDIAVKQIPTSFSIDIVWLALPFALNLTLLAYLDTLLTSLVVDKKVKEIFGYEDNTKQNKELVAQGLANGLVAFIGGIPGAQATIRSVLILKENATLRLAGILSGLFVLVEMLAFQDLVGDIPKAVFAGLLIKVGYDVMDWEPLIAWTKQFGQKTGAIKITMMDMVFIAGTTIVTVIVNLNVAVISFTVLYYVLRKVNPALVESPAAAAEDAPEDA